MGNGEGEGRGSRAGRERKWRKVNEEEGGRRRNAQFWQVVKWHGRAMEHGVTVPHCYLCRLICFSFLFFFLQILKKGTVVLSRMG